MYGADSRGSVEGTDASGESGKGVGVEDGAWVVGKTGRSYSMFVTAARSAGAAAAAMAAAIAAVCPTTAVPDRVPRIPWLPPIMPW